MDIREPQIKPEDMLVLKDPQFTTENVCIVSGCGTGIGRAVAVAAAAKGKDPPPGRRHGRAHDLHPHRPDP